MSGWISIHRQLQDHWLYKENRTFSKLEAWIDILLTVNHTDAQVVIKNTVYEVKRGESIHSLDTWGNRWKWNKSKVRRFLRLLQKQTMIELKDEQKTTRLTVCNYDSYQGIRNADETKVKRKRNADETQTTPNNNDNNENNENNENKFFSEQVHQVYESVVYLFPENTQPKTEAQEINWKEDIRKLIELDGHKAEEIMFICDYFRKDSFWSTNFQTLLKLRKDNKDKIKFIDYFKNQLHGKSTNQFSNLVGIDRGKY